MHKLTSFNNSTSDISIEAAVTRDKSLIKLIFKTEDAKNYLNLPKPFNTSSARREDGLWNDTCFELFLRPEGESSYYEFNFSLQPAWNQYFFTAYRQPQPPKRSDDFSLKKINWNGHTLEIELAAKDADKAYQASLTTVLKEKTGTIHYMAVKHAATEADFHDAKSFVINL